MKSPDQNKLDEMHDLIAESGIASFDTDFLEKYTELLVECLKNKNNETLVPTNSRSDHSLV